MMDKPNSIHLISLFLEEGEDHKEAREQIAKAWRHIHRKNRKDLGPRGCLFGALSSMGPNESYSVEDVLFSGSTYA